MPTVVQLASHHAGPAAALWREAGLVRPWNDPEGDFRRAVRGATSAVLGMPDAAGSALRGTVMVGADGHRGWVYYLAVRDADRGRGLGRDLMQAAEEWLRAAGAPKVQLMVRSENAGVIGFYERLGYADQGVAVLGKFLDPELEALRRDGR